MLNIVVIKFIAPNKEDTPAKCILKIAKSTPFSSNIDKGG